MLNQRSGSSTRVGIVYQYQDPGNFYEASFSPTGSVFVRDVTNGLGTTVATGTYSGGGQNKWFDVEVAWTAAETIVLVNGLPVVRGIKQDRLTHGRVGVITRQTTAKFDRLLVTIEYGDPEFRESFSAGAPSWDVVKGNWSVVNGAYQNSAVQHGSITLLPIFVGLDDSSADELIRGACTHAQPLWRQRQPHGVRIQLFEPTEPVAMKRSCSAQMVSPVSITYRPGRDGTTT